MKKFSTFKDVTIDIAKEVYLNPEYITSPRNQITRERLNYSFCLTNPLSCLIEKNDEIPNCYSKLKYISAELLWYFSKTNKIDFIKEYSSMWSNITNENNEVNSAYGNLIFSKEENSQFAWVIESLINDENSRQAVMHFNNESHQYLGNKDFVCTMYASFFIRENKLHMSVHMRSNDVVFGLFNDIAFFVSLQQLVLLYLRNKKYPDLELGYYYHLSNSLHIYERHFQMFENLLLHQDKLESSDLPVMNANVFKDYSYKFQLNSFLQRLYEHKLRGENVAIHTLNTTDIKSNYNTFIFINLQR